MVGRGGPHPVITVLVGASAAVGDVVELDGDEAHHLRVRRAAGARAPDTRVAVRDGAGLVAEGHLSVAGRRVTVAIERAALAPPPAPLVLAVGAGDRERFGGLVEKAAEVGATALVPLETARSLSVASRLRGEHMERLRRRARETVKQSGAPWAPAVADPIPLEQFLADHLHGGVRSGTAARWLADGAGAPPPATLTAEAPVVAVVGPEGGLTDDERAAVLAAGYVAVALGPHVLRFDTAAIAVAVSATIARRRGTP
jgi:16S rRNA (uracil1498-N3)-methyltransferase